MEYCGVRVRKYYSKIYDREIWIDPYNMLPGLVRIIWKIVTLKI